MIIACCVMKGSVYTFEMETVSETEVGHSTKALVLSCFVMTTAFSNNGDEENDL